MFYGHSWIGVSPDDFAQELDDSINWYNCKRIKLSLGGLSPIEYRQRLGCAVWLVLLSVRTPVSEICFLKPCTWNSKLDAKKRPRARVSLNHSMKNRKHHVCPMTVDENRIHRKQPMHSNNQNLWIYQRRIDYSIHPDSLNSVYILSNECRRLLYHIIKSQHHVTIKSVHCVTICQGYSFFTEKMAFA